MAKNYLLHTNQKIPTNNGIEENTPSNMPSHKGHRNVHFISYVFVDIIDIKQLYFYQHGK